MVWHISRERKRYIVIVTCNDPVSTLTFLIKLDGFLEQFLAALFSFLVLSSLQSTMNLPPDKLKLLSQYDNEKKWELVCDQVRRDSIRSEL